MKSFLTYKVLITRPIHQAQALAHKIIAQGDDAIIFPTQEICPVSLNEQLPQDFKFDMIIFTSANAVFFLPPLLSLEGSKIIAIGPATAQALSQKKLAVTAVALPPYTSEMLLQLPELQNVRNKKIALFTGKDGRTTIKNELLSRGAEVKMVICYQRRPISHPPTEVVAKCASIDIIISSSLESLINFTNLLPPELKLFDKILIVINEKMVAYAQQIGFTKIILAANATDDALMTALTGFKNANTAHH